MHCLDMTAHLGVSCFCGAESAKYKCPICRTPYCSVNCFRVHKSTPCTAPPPPASKDPLLNEDINPHFATEDTLPVDKLQLLDNHSNLHELLGNPHLRHIMESIDKSKNPTDLIAQAMLEPIFVEFATECLKVTESKEIVATFSDDED